MKWPEQVQRYRTVTSSRWRWYLVDNGSSFVDAIIGHGAAYKVCLDVSFSFCSLDYDIRPHWDGR